MQPAWVGAQGEAERRLWSTVLEPAAAELADRAEEIVRRGRGLCQPVATRSARRRRGPGSEQGAEASRRDFAEVIFDGAPIYTRPGASRYQTLDYALDGVHRRVPLTVLLRSYRLSLTPPHRSST